jgi:hypothetical protein
VPPKADAAPIPTPNAAPNITLQPQDQTVTAPAAATFQVTATGTPAPTYQWSVNGQAIPGATGASYTTPATAAAQNGFTYTVAVDNGVGAAAVSRQASLTVQTGPAFVTMPAGAVVAPGTAWTFSVTVTGLAPIQYQWFQGGVPIPGANAATYTTAPVLPADDGTAFSVAVSDGTGIQVVSDPAVLIVGQAPSISQGPMPVSVLAPTPATFTVTATGHPLTYQWQDGVTNIPGANSASYTIPVTTAAFNGKNYRVVVGGFGTSVTSNSALLTVSGPVIITTEPLAQIINPGSQLTLNVVATGDQASMTYQWYFNGSQLAGQTSATYNVNPAGPANSGDYYVVVSDGYGSPVQSADAFVLVTPIHTVSGHVTLVSGGPAPAGITMSIDTYPRASTTTAADGSYSLPAVPAGDWTVTPSAPGLSSVFFPAVGNVNVDTTNVTTLDFQANLGYTVTGSVTYPGNRLGPIYLKLVDANGDSTLGTTIGGAGAFTIRGVPSGTYTLHASMDISLGTLYTVNDPSGTLPVTVNGADLSGQALVLADPVGLTIALLPGPTRLTMSPMASGAVAVFPSMTPVGFEQAAQYIIEWSATADFRTIIDNISVQPRRPRNVVFIGPEHGLADGQVLFFRVYGAAGGNVSHYTNAAGSITIGERVGGYTVSGAVNFSNSMTATGPLYVGLLDRSNRLGTRDKAYIARIDPPANNQPFAVNGLPAVAGLGGGYQLIGFIDQNTNGRNEAGDISGVPISNLAVTANREVPDLDLLEVDSEASVRTLHAQTSQGQNSFRLIFRVRDQNKHVISATLTDGPNIMVPMDLANPNSTGTDLAATIDLGGTIPQVGDSYTMIVNYSDGTSDLHILPVATPVQNDFVADPQPSDPNAAVALGTNVVPTFSWNAPALPPANFEYLFTLQGGGVSQSARLDDATQYPWPGANLIRGTTYTWSVIVRDTDTGNETVTINTYTPAP